MAESEVVDKYMARAACGGETIKRKQDAPPDKAQPASGDGRLRGHYHQPV
jgi:hypothetical protein